MPRITFVQPGARHNYALPRFLFDNGMLQRLYTDFAFGTGDRLLAVLKTLLPRGVYDKLARRRIDELPARLVRSGSSVRVGRLGVRDVRRYSANDVARSDGFYLQYFAGGETIRRLAPNKTIISDVFIVPYAHRAINVEIAAFPDWGESPIPPALAQFYDDRAHIMFEQSDLLFCPSQAVIEDVARYDEAFRAKCRLVEYGASLTAPKERRPEPGRVLFSGSLQLRKGVQYIRAAAAALEASHPHIRFVLAGTATPSVRAKMQAPNIDLLGHLGKDEMAREYGRADIFLFPSLAEGAAGSVLEALASGLPIVGTREGGVDFTDGVSGIVVPPRDPAAIAAAVVRLCEDRPLRDAVAANAMLEAERYSMAAWEARFIAAIRDVF